MIAAEKAYGPGGYALRNIMRDTAVLRCLEVAGYVRVPDKFFVTVNSTWTLGADLDPIDAASC